MALNAQYADFRRRQSTKICGDRRPAGSCALPAPLNDEQLGLSVALAALRARVSFTERQHPMLFECMRRQVCACCPMRRPMREQNSAQLKFVKQAARFEKKIAFKSSIGDGRNPAISKKFFATVAVCFQRNELTLQLLTRNSHSRDRLNVILDAFLDPEIHCIYKCVSFFGSIRRPSSFQRLNDQRDSRSLVRPQALDAILHMLANA